MSPSSTFSMDEDENSVKIESKDPTDSDGTRKNVPLNSA